MISFDIKVPSRPGRRLRVLVRDSAWINKGDLPLLKKGYLAKGWFKASLGKVYIGTVAIAEPDLTLEVVSHECGHAAWHLTSVGGLPPDEEEQVTMAGKLTEKVWERIQKEMTK